MLKSAIKQNCRPLSKCRWFATNHNFPKQKDLSRTKERYVNRLPLKLIRQTLVSIFCELNHYTLFAIAVCLL